MSSSSNVWNLCSNCCFLFEKCAREATSLGASGHVHRVLFWCKGSLFSKPFPVHFFSEKLCQMDTNMASKVEKILSQMTLKMKSNKTCTKWVKIDAAGPAKNEFSNGRVVKNHENQRCGQLRKHVKKWCQTSTEITEKWALELNKKRCLKTYPKKSKNTQKWRQKWTPETH